MHTIAKTAELTGLSPDTLRYYERIGLLKPPQRTAGGVRSYNDEDVHLLQAIHCLKNVGLSLDDVKEFVREGRFVDTRSLMSDRGEIAVLRRRYDILSSHLRAMVEQRRNLDRIIRQTRGKLRHYDSMIDRRDEAESE